PMEERLVSGFSAICGASDAFTFLYVEALASAGVKQGFPKPMALQMAKEVVLGAAKLLESGAGNPMELADMVCSPGGTTIEGVHKLREHGFEYAVYEAVGAVADKDRLLGKK
ncbi:MAG: pyrroline-5-carboxylate reductase, partial [Oscillospiraceae bacterium]|nr:pyrroline-5-carboxylate reductase [Oscillospiraceae bacterium]